MPDVVFTLSPSTSIKSHAPSHDISADDTPSPSVRLSPTVNLSHEYILAAQNNSDTELQRTSQPLLFEQILQPSRDYVRQALSLMEHNTLSRLLTTYFEYSEQILRLGILLYQNILNARLVYAPIHKLLGLLDSDCCSLSLSQCILAFSVFLEFDRFENPFESPGAASFIDMQNSFSQLKQELEHNFRKPRHRRRFTVLTPCWMCPAITPNSAGHLAQIDSAAKAIYILLNDLHTIERLMACLHDAVETDKHLVEVGLEKGVDGQSIQELLKELRRSCQKFGALLVDFEEHLFLCIATINRGRSRLVQEIVMEQTEHKCGSF